MPLPKTERHEVEDEDAKYTKRKRKASQGKAEKSLVPAKTQSAPT